MKIILVFFLAHFVFVSMAQKHDYIWQLGDPSPYSMTLDFNYQNDSVYSINRLVSMFLTNTSICDSAGNLLFYTNGIQIADSTHQIMLNGDSLNPGGVANDFYDIGYNWPESAIILPMPEQDSIYYLFHIRLKESPASYADNLYFTKININLNNRKGEVIDKNHLLLQDTIFNELEAMKHANGLDWWLLFPRMYDNVFYRFLLTKDSIYGPFSQRIGNASPGDDFSQAVFSPDGTKYARYYVFNDLDIYDFDRCTGLLSNYQHITIYDTSDILQGLPVAGLVFSSNSRYLYVNSAGLFVYQFDVQAPNISASIDTVAIYDGYYIFHPDNQAAFYLGQLAPNGKIYFNSTGSVDVLHMIHSPDSAGSACNFEQHGLQLPNEIIPTLPNFPHYRTPVLSTPCDTLMSTIASIPIQTEEIKLYPNPTSDILFIESIKNIYKIKVYDALGREVLSLFIPQKTDLELNTSALENGIYFISIFMEGKIIHRQFQILR